MLRHITLCLSLSASLCYSADRALMSTEQQRILLTKAKHTKQKRIDQTNSLATTINAHQDIEFYFEERARTQGYESGEVLDCSKNVVQPKAQKRARPYGTFHGQTLHDEYASFENKHTKKIKKLFP